jgi:hypothetical protein
VKTLDAPLGRVADDGVTDPGPLTSFWTVTDVRIGPVYWSEAGRKK